VPDEKDNSDRIQVLLEQYKIAADLYKNEDNLNWNKFHNLLYVTSILFAGYAITKNYPILHFIIPAVGIIASVGFFISLSNGKKYLLLRRNNIERVEIEIYNYGAIKQLISDEKITSLAKTIDVIRWFPFILMFAWILLFLFAIISVLLDTSLIGIVKAYPTSEFSNYNTS